MTLEEVQKLIPVREGEDFDRNKVQRYLQNQLNLRDAPLEVFQFSTGFSNLTYMLRMGDWDGVLRRPPNGPLPPKAHDMGREYELLSKLYPYFPYVPEPYLFCEEKEIIGVPFYVMEWKKGVVLDDQFPPNIEISNEMLRILSYQVVDRLAELHMIDYKKAGLEHFGRPDGFIKRQVYGWIKRYEKVKTEEIPYVDKIQQWLINRIPKTNEASITHNDYKLNNMLISGNLTEINAILDWELATIGDPYFDLGGALVYWIQENDPEYVKESLPSLISTRSGFISREEFLHRYASKTGKDIPNMRFYMALNYYKLAVALQQIYYRWKIRQSKDARFATFNKRVHSLMQHTYELIEK